MPAKESGRLQSFAVLTLFYRRIQPKYFLFFLPGLWVALEHLRSFLISGFPWYFAGHSQVRWTRLIQIADITGVYGVSFLLLLSNVLVSMIIIRLVRKKALKDEPAVRLAWPLAGLLVVLVGASLIYGSFRINQTKTKSGPTICLIQGNIPQSLKLDSDFHKDMFETYFKLTVSVTEKDIDLIVWPETMAPGWPNVDEELQEFFAKLSRRMNASLLIGALAVEGYEWEDLDEQAYEAADKYNSVYFFSFEKEGKLSGRYDKIHLVPFSEYMPLRKHLPFLKRVVPEGFGILTPGRDLSVFDLKGHKFSAAICYENSVADIVRKFASKGVDFLVVATNDGWFQDTRELDEHFAISRFRAVENRLPIAYSANTGISGFIDSLGRVQSFIRDKSGKYREVKGTLTGTVRLDDRKTVYMRYGDILGVVCIVISVLGLAVFGRKRSKVQR